MMPGNRLTMSLPARPTTPRMLKLSAIVGDFFAAPWSFKLTCLYVFFEYVRPQQIYPWLAGPSWALILIMAALVAFVVEGLRVPSRTLINGLLLAFSAVLFASAFAAEYPALSMDKLSIYLNWLLAFLLIANTATTERRFALFIVFFLLWSTKMSQHGFRTWVERGFSFADYGVAGTPGWFSNSGEFALQMTIFVPLSLYFIIGLYPNLKRWQVWALALLPITGVGTIAASSSRGGQIALAAIAIWMIGRSKRRVRTFVTLGVLGPLVWLAIPAEQKLRFSESGTDKTSVLRLQYWQAGIEMANKHPVLGIGYENWRPYYEQHYFNPSDTLAAIDFQGRPVIETSHNSFVEVGSQLGYTGLAFFVALLISTWVVNAKSRKLLVAVGERGRFLYNISLGLDGGMIGFVVAGFFMAVAFYPFVWFQLAMTGALNVVARQLALSDSSGKRTPRAVASARPEGARASTTLRGLSGGTSLNRPAMRTRR